MSDSHLRDSSANIVAKELAAHAHDNVSVFFFDELYSTSLWLEQRVQYAEAKVPELCATHWQTGGIARRGRKWQTAPGNITFSMKTYTEKPVGELLGLSLVTGIGVARCLEDQTGLSVKIKWPNDIIVDNRKLSGLLTEVRAGLVSTIITGIGINVLQDKDVAELGIGACSLEELLDDPVDRDELLGKVAAAVLTSHGQFLREGWSVFAQEWEKRDWLVNRQVTINRGGEREVATARGVDGVGAMIVEDMSGNRTTIVSGEVSVRPVGDPRS